MLAAKVVVALVYAAAAVSTAGTPDTPAQQQQRQRASRLFSAFETCAACVDAGFGWSTAQQRCGAFKNKACGGPAVPQAPGGGNCGSDGDGDGAVAAARQQHQDQQRQQQPQFVPSAAELAAFQPRTTPFAWTPLWSAPMAAGRGGVDVRELRRIIMADRKVNEGTKKSNDGGFHSSGDFLAAGGDSPAPALRRTKDEIYRHVHAYLRALAKSTASVGGPGAKPYRIFLGTSWYNINKKGHFNNVHTHDGSHLSGVIYVDDAGDKAACTQFFDARGQRATFGALDRSGGGGGGGGGGGASDDDAAATRSLLRQIYSGTNQ
eukprot:SAG22_NODE_59_length_23617_cov_252.868144_11_plen_320_part_00